MKAEIKWIGNGWRAFEDDRSHFSASIVEICGLVEDSMQEKMETRTDIEWRSTGTKLVAEPSTKLKKMSKSDP